jgi:protein-disulfide isomerase
MSMNLARLRALAVAGLIVSAGCNDAKLEELGKQQQQILEKLAALEEKIDKAATRTAAAAARPTGPDPARAYELPVGQSPVRGKVDAAITIVEFSDYQCPYCAKAEPLIASFVEAYPNDTRVVFKHYPLTNIHPHAMPAALAATAAQKQGKFWEMHDQLFANQRSLNPAQITETAKKLGLDMTRFEADMKSPEVAAAVQADMKLAQQVGIRGTPSIFVNGKLLTTRTVDGFKELAAPAVAGKAAAR